MNGKPAIPSSSFKWPVALNTLGVGVLLLGLGAAGGVYWSGQAQPAGTGPEASGWRDSTLDLEDSKSSSRDVEMYYGKVGMLIVRLQDWCAEPAALALMLAIISTLAALGCFLAAKRLRPQPRGQPR